jgi:hypothetical protein
MRGAVMYGPGDVRVEERDEPQIVEPTDAIIGVSAACVCGSDLSARVGDDCDFRREALDQFPLTVEDGARDEQREVQVLVAGGLDPIVERPLDRLPDRVAVRLDHHGAAYQRILRETGAADDLPVPGWEVD